MLWVELDKIGVALGWAMTFCSWVSISTEKEKAFSLALALVLTSYFEDERDLS